MSNQIDLTVDERKRYDRHLRLADFGLEKQLKLKRSKVLLVGAGGLGCPIGLYLAASGVGTMGIADNDKIDLSNLQRQIAFSINEIGEYKTKALAQKLHSLNSLIQIDQYISRIDESNVETFIKNYDLIIDGTDNFISRFLIADACFTYKKAYLHASVYQYQGQVSLFSPNQSPCFRCLFRQPPNSALAACSEAGILGVITGTIGLLAATEAIKYLTGLGEAILGKVLLYNALNQQTKLITIETDSNCPSCSNKIFSKKEFQSQLNKGACTMQSTEDEMNVTAEESAKWIKNDKDLFLLDVRETHEYEQGHIADAPLLPLSILKNLFTAESNPESQEYLTVLPKNKDQKILCYCRRGGRSLQATHILRHAGYKNTFSMDGGIEAWAD